MLDDLKNFIDVHSDEAIDFGSRNEAPSKEAINAAEELIGTPFPPSYRWFVENYGGGYIYGNEIYSVIENPVPGIYQGDIAALTLRFRSEGTILPSDIALCSTDFGELFSFDASRPEERGEYDVYRIVAGQRALFAASFAEFVVKFVDNSNS